MQPQQPVYSNKCFRIDEDDCHLYSCRSLAQQDTKTSSSTDVASTEATNESPMVTNDPPQPIIETQQIFKIKKRDQKHNQKKIFSRGNQGNATVTKMMFFLKRTGIRGMGKYYRKKYEEFRAKKGIKLSLKDVKNLEELKGKMTDYVEDEFSAE